MLTLSLMVDIGARLACEGCTGQGPGPRLSGPRVAGRARGARAVPPRADLSNTLRFLALAGAARRQSITCFIFTYSTHENRNPNIGMTAIPTPTAAKMMRWSRIWFVNCRMQPWNLKANCLAVHI